MSEALKYKIYIIGCGPGDPELMTVKAVRLIEKADVIFYETNVDGKYLEQFDAVRYAINKGEKDNSISPSEANEKIYQEVLKGKNVVRLKGGDPSIFGRIGGEIRFFRDRGVEVEIVPGVTIALAAAAFYKIPLTQKQVASGVAFCSGMVDEDIVIPNVDTIVYYMCSENVKTILSKMIIAGWSENSAVMFVKNVCQPKEEARISRIKDELVEENDYNSTLIMILGKPIDLNFNELQNEIANRGGVR